MAKRTAEQERKDIVAYLRANASMVPERFEEALRRIADDIEKGDHEGSAS